MAFVLVCTLRAVDSEHGTSWACETVEIWELPGVCSNTQDWWAEEGRGRYNAQIDHLSSVA